jgi:hypothetical protein
MEMNMEFIGVTLGLPAFLRGTQANPLDVRNVPPILAGKFLPPPGQQDRSLLPSVLFFSQLPFFKGGNPLCKVNGIKKALLPLKKGGREGFLGRLFNWINTY